MFRKLLCACQCEPPPPGILVDGCSSSSSRETRREGENLTCTSAATSCFTGSSAASTVCGADSSSLDMEPYLKGPLSSSAGLPHVRSSESNRFHSTKYTWSQLNQFVRANHANYAALTCKVPQGFTFAERTVETEDGESMLQERLYFLGLNDKTREHTIQFIDLPSGDAQSDWSRITPPVPANLLDAFPMGSSLHYVSQGKEEQLIRERKRLPSIGITSYECDPKCDTVLFLNSKALYWCKPNQSAAKHAHLNTITRQKSPPLYPKVCPSNPDLISYISHGDLFVTCITPQQQSGSPRSGSANHSSSSSRVTAALETRLTFTNNDSSPAVGPVTAGIPSFVSQEEFDRFIGYWWAPVHSEDNVYCIAYEEVDESLVEQVKIQNPLHVGSDSYRYPRPGTHNAKSSLKLVKFRFYPEDGSIQLMNTGCSLGNQIEACVTDPEYLARAGWCGTGQYVWSQWLSRDQKKLSIVLCSVTAFVEESTHVKLKGFEDATMRNLDEPEPLVRLIYEDVSDVWINIHDIMHILPPDRLYGQRDSVEFVFASQSPTGYRHLYRICSDLATTPPDDRIPCSCIATPLTAGQWEVLGRHIWVDEGAGLVYFLGLKDSCLEAQLYACSYRHPNVNSIVRLTEPGFYHNVHFNRACSLYIDVYSNLTTPPQVSINRVGSEVVEALAGSESSIPVESTNQCVIQRAQYPNEMHVPELFHFPSGDKQYTLNGLLYKPDNYQPGLRYPTLLYVYGGPQVQFVCNSFKGQQFLRLHSLLTVGFAVVIIDGRGSANRGLHFESYIKGSLGMVEVNDQVAGLEYIASKSGCIDLSRVAIHGWSYGGYVSLLALAQNPCKFRCAAAAAPVTSWREYDTGYTERYLGLPEDNPAGYGSSAVLNYIQHFPSEANRLLLIHGSIDENVHYRHSAILINALVMNCKPFTQITYPVERHGLRHIEAGEHFETSLLHFFNSNI